MWGNCLTVTDTRDASWITQKFGHTDFASKPGRYRGQQHRGCDFSVRRDHVGPFLEQWYKAPVNARIAQVIDSPRGYA